MPKVTVTNSSDTDRAKAGVYVEAGKTSEAVEVDSSELRLLEVDPDLSYELAESQEDSEEDVTDDLPVYGSENADEGDSSADAENEDKLSEEYVNQGLSVEEAAAEEEAGGGSESVMGEAVSSDSN